MKRRDRYPSGWRDVPDSKILNSCHYKNNIEVSFDILSLPEIREIKLSKDHDKKLLMIFDNTLFKSPIFGKVNKSSSYLKLFINQSFLIKNEYSLKNLLICLLELSDLILSDNEQEDDKKLIIFFKREFFENQVKLLIKNLNWLGGELVLNDDENFNTFNDWYIMQFEV